MNDPLVGHVERSIMLAELGISKLDRALFFLNGMSSPRVRHFLNNLCERPGSRYLEIGCWRGSTLVSALYGNDATAGMVIAIDNFSEFQVVAGESVLNVNPLIDLLDEKNRVFFLSPKPPREDLLEKIAHFLKAGAGRIDLHDDDCFSPVLLEQLRQRYPGEPINTYLYDGAHDQDSQCRAFVEFDFILDRTFVAIVDDWNTKGVKEGTYQAFDQLGYRVLRQWELPSRGNGDLQNWWNGLYVAVVQKPQRR